ncbi:hypothetical protein [Solilutibacter silvestris]|uniref:hypothetical protein n=1 Tax=Solilutibacter silvestris TaxID=1645665 RepID=UPI001F0B779C|nr:hypothetical protein [Lysobacter silvestris]
MREDEATNPAKISLLRAATVIEPPDALADCLEQLRLESDGLVLQRSEVGSLAADDFGRG